MIDEPAPDSGGFCITFCISCCHPQRFDKSYKEVYWFIFTSRMIWSDLPLEVKEQE